jgi:diguanylate cyclase (GGDEF)-like protein/PAS domain S-box-containing protein
LLQVSRSLENRRSRVPAAPLARVRLLFLALAVASAAATMPVAAQASQSLVLRAAAVLLALGLSAHWIAGYRAKRFPLAAEPLEAAVIFALLRVLPGEPFLPLFELVFRSLYGNLAVAALRYALYAAALLGAHAPRGAVHLHEDLSRVVGLAVAPGVMHAFRAALEGLAASERRLRSLVQNSTDIVTVADTDLRVRWQAESIRRALGHDPGRLVGMPLGELVHRDDYAVLERYAEDARGRPGFSRTLALRLRHHDGHYQQFDVVASNRLHDAAVRGHVLNMRDATERHRLERELRELADQREHDAMHDPLTGLANRRRLFAVLESALASAEADQAVLAMLLIDLDLFKELNDTLGHDAGDRLLREIGPRLEQAARGAQLVARLGGDEFAVLVRPGVDGPDAAATAEQVRHAIEQPFRVQGLTLLVRASVGVAIYPEHADSVETLMQRADVAMYSAKARGVGHEVYSASRDEHSKERLALLGELPDAIAGGQLVVHYQPKLDLASGEITGAEALVRWDHPQRGMLGPGEFLPLAEQTGLMRPLTLQVLDRALADCERWDAAGTRLRVAVNLAAPNLLDLALPGDVADRLLERRLAPSRLQLEITETIVAADPVRVSEILAELRELGVILSLDDFGTGSSSLGYLRRLPVQELKIDKSFILGMADDDQASAIVRTTIDLAHTLGLRAVAEGVETEPVLERLKSYGCDEAQGFLLGRPMPAEQLAALARRHARPMAA